MATSTKSPDDVVKPKTKEVLIDGRVYDVTKFKHPGGSIINFMLDADATDVYREMHYRSKKADKVLKALPSREFGSKESDKKQFFTHGEVPAVNDDVSTAAPDSSENEDELAAIKVEERKKNAERLEKNRARNEKLMKEFRELEEQLKKEGIFDPCIPHVIWRMIELVLLHMI